jgi:hypothetical protein
MRARRIASAMLLATAACGSGETAGHGPNSPAPTSSVAGVTESPPNSAASHPSSNASTAKRPGTQAAKPNAIPNATLMGAQLAEIGLDAKALPPLNKLSPDQLRKVMKTFTKALGVSCDGCHDTKDFHASTPHKRIATHMWNDFSRTLSFGDGQAVYCDSCHAGRATFLERKDVAALSQWMQESYVDSLKRVDQKDHGCETCHGDPMEPKIFAKVWKK